MRYTPEIITTLEPHQTFVFGSNLAGRHGAGAALLAKKAFGAEHGIGEGLTGQCYALPTKDENIQTRPLHEIGESFRKFLHVVLNNKNSDFLLTKVGCGLAGYTVDEIASEFWNAGEWIGHKKVPTNLWIPKEFADYRVKDLVFC